MFCLIFRLQIWNKCISMNTYVKSIGYDEDSLETVYTDMEYMDVFLPIGANWFDIFGNVSILAITVLDGVVWHTWVMSYKLHGVPNLRTIDCLCSTPPSLPYKPHQIPKVKCFSSPLAVGLYPSHWSRVLSREWRYSWSNADRRCSNYIWLINNFIAY